MKRLCLLIVMVITYALHAGALSRSSSYDPKGSFCLTSGEEKHKLLVKFKPEYNVRLRDGRLKFINRAASDQATDYLRNSDINFIKAINISEEKLDELEYRARKGAARRGTDALGLGLNSMFYIETSDNSNDALYNLAIELESLESVQYCELYPTTPPPPPGLTNKITNNYNRTTNFFPQQSYLMESIGNNLLPFWDIGITGQGVKIADIEYEWNFEHEEFAGVPHFKVADGITVGNNPWGHYHGTAVMGQIVAKNDNSGVTGGAYGADAFLGIPETSVEGGGWNRPHSIAHALTQLEAGDVFLYEIQISTSATNNEYVPAEFMKSVWDLTRTATDAGIIIVATGSNGNQNMDSYTEYMERGDSGAIMVGAGTSGVNTAKLGFSTYGSRFDVQAWGQHIVTTGNNGTLNQQSSDINKQYSNSFGGTSGAGPCITNVVVLLQSYAKNKLDRNLTAPELRKLMKENGRPQTTGGHIGPRPDAYRCLLALKEEIPRPEFVNYFSNKVTWTYGGIAAEKFVIYQDGIKVGEVDGNERSFELANPPEGAVIFGVSAVHNSKIKDESLPATYNYSESAVKNNDSFESSDFFGHFWNYNHNKAWTITNSDASDGSFSAKSANIPNNNLSILSAKLNVKAGTVSFSKKVSCESKNGDTWFDHLSFKIDGVEMGRWSGNTGWSNESYEVSEGKHLFEWIYLKDGNTVGGQDAAWIDNVTFPETVVGISENQEVNNIVVNVYPNPFNPITTISYTVETKHLSPINLSVYNAKGQLVKTLVNRAQKTGSYSIRFDGSSLNSGIYFYRLSSGINMNSGKIVLIK